MLGNESVVDFKTNIKLSLPKLFLIKFNDTNFKKIRKKVEHRVSPDNYR